MVPFCAAPEVTLVNTTAKVEIFRHVVPAGTVTEGRQLRLNLGLAYLKNAIGSLTFEVSFGPAKAQGRVVIADGDLSNNPNERCIAYDVTISSRGGLPDGQAVTQTALVGSNVSKSANRSGLAVDATLAQPLVVTAQFSAASPGLRLTMEHAILEVAG